MSRPRSPPSRALRVAVAVLGTAAAFAWVASTTDVDAVAGALRQSDPRWWLVALLLVPLQTLLAAERWYRASLAVGLPLPRRRAWMEFALSSAVNQLLPGGIAGDGWRVWRQRQQQDGLMGAARAALVDRWWGQSVLAAVVLLGLWVWPASIPTPNGLAWGVGVCSAGVGAVWLAPQGLPGAGPLARDLRRSCRLPSLPVLSLLLLGAILAGFAACGAAVGIPAGPWLLCVAPLALLATSVPISLGGWGLREGSVVALLPLFGAQPAHALALSLLFGVAFLLGTLPGMLVLFRSPETLSP